MSRVGAMRIETLLSAVVAVLLIVGGYAWNRGTVRRSVPSTRTANVDSKPGGTTESAASAASSTSSAIALNAKTAASPNGTVPQPDSSETDKPRRLANGPLFDGKSLAGWHVADKINFDMHGKVAVEDGAIRMAPGQPATGIVWVGDEAKTSSSDGKSSASDAKKSPTVPFPRVNYELRLEAMRTEGNDFFCGLTFPIGEEYCTLIIGGWGGGVVGLSNVDNYSAVENETTDYRDFKDNTWYRIRLRVTAGKVEVWIDDESVIDLETKGKKFSIWWEQEPMRPFGIATWYTGTAIRNVVLSSVRDRAAK